MSSVWVYSENLTIPFDETAGTASEDKGGYIKNEATWDRFVQVVGRLSRNDQRRTWVGNEPAEKPLKGKAIPANSVLGYTFVEVQSRIKSELS